MLPRPDVRGPIGDRSIGPLVARKLGPAGWSTRLVDPLVGGIHAGSVDDMSAAAIFPPLLAAAQRRGSLMRALRAEVPGSRTRTGPPLFWALEGGMAALVQALADGLRERAVDIRLSARGRTTGAAPADALVRLAAGDGGRGRTRWCWPRRHRPRRRSAAPARRRGGRRCSTASTTPRSSLVRSASARTTSRPPLQGTGFLVPRRSPHRGREAWAVTACTYLDRKWPHLARDGEVLLRASLGRVDDTRAEDGATRRSSSGPGRSWARSWASRGQPSEAVVTRFPGAFPQYRVHHLLRTAGVEAAVARLGGLAAGRRGLPRGRHPRLRRQRPGRGTRAVVNRLPRRGRVAAPSLPAGVLLALSLPAVGLVAARPRWVPGCSTGASAGLPLRARVWSGWLAGLGCYAIGLAWARAFNWYGAVVLVLVEALFFAAAAAATPPRRGRAPAFVGACTLAEAVRMTWPFGGLPLGGVFLGQADGPLVELARLGGPLLITAGVWAGGVAVATLGVAGSGAGGAT